MTQPSSHSTLPLDATGAVGQLQDKEQPTGTAGALSRSNGDTFDLMKHNAQYEYATMHKDGLNEGKETADAVNRVGDALANQKTTAAYKQMEIEKDIMANTEIYWKMVKYLNDEIELNGRDTENANHFSGFVDGFRESFNNECRFHKLPTK